MRDSKGGGKRGKPAFGFPRFPRTGFFHSPAAAAFLLFPDRAWVAVIPLCRKSVLAAFLLLQGPTETIGFRSGLDNVGLIGQPVEHRFAEARVGEPSTLCARTD